MRPEHISAVPDSIAEQSGWRRDACGASSGESVDGSAGRLVRQMAVVPLEALPYGCRYLLSEGEYGGYRGGGGRGRVG